MDLKDFDLNLLRSLNALLEEVNVTRAAERLCVTQPAMSGALRRLREHFGDNLLVREGRRMERTALGESLHGTVGALLCEIQASVETRPHFDPQTSYATFSVSISDYCALVLMPEVLRRLSTEAPHLSCDIRPLSTTSFAQLERGYLDLVITADHWSLYADYKPTPETLTAELFRDDFVCVVDRDNRAVGDTLSLEEYCRLTHGGVTFGRGMEALVEEAWDRGHLSLRIAVKAPDFSSLVLMVPGTPLIVTAQRRLCEVLSLTVPLRITECPVPIRPLRETMVWHGPAGNDPVHRFMRDIIREAARTIKR